MCALTVDVPEFIGPLDLLLSLIVKRRLDVTTVSLATVADQYLDQVRSVERQLDALSEFLLLASQLLLIKSRALLPATPDAEPEGDPAEELRRRLAEYQVLQAAARWLGEREEAGARSWPRGGELPAVETEPLLAPIAAAALAGVLARQLRRRPSAQAVQTLAAVARPSLQQRAEVIYGALIPERWVRVTGPLLGSDVATAVATFLAILVLVRRGLVATRQSDWSAALELRRCPGAPPALGALGALD